MATPYELLAGLALLREKKRHLEINTQGDLEEWSALIVRLGTHQCVIRHEHVSEVATLGSVTPVQGMHSWLVGVSYFRGQLLNLIHTLTLFDENAVYGAGNGRVLVVQGRQEWFGFYAEELIGIRHVWSDTVTKPCTPEQQQLFGDYAERRLLIENEFLPVLDIRKLMMVLEEGRKP